MVRLWTKRSYSIFQVCEVQRFNLSFPRMRESRKTLYFINLESAVIAELRAAGIKHSAEKILRIARKADGALVFLETGDEKAGWQHIREDHADDFANRGIPENKLQEAIMAAVTRGKILGNQGKSRVVYEVELGASRFCNETVGAIAFGQ